MDPSTPTPDAAQIPDARDNMTSPAIPSPAAPSSGPSSEAGPETNAPDNRGNGNDAGAPPQSQQQSFDQQNNRGGGGGGQQHQGGGGQQRERDHRHNGRRGRNQRGRRQRGGGGQPNGPRGDQQQQGGGQRAPLAPVVPDGETTGWFDPQREGGFIRRSANSYLAEPGDAYVPTRFSPPPATITAIASS